MQPEARSKNSIRALGHIHLCGVLHVSWQTRDGVDGQYLICLLYRDFLILASTAKTEQIYTIQACIGLCEVSVEEVDNGRGMSLPIQDNFLNVFLFRATFVIGLTQCDVEINSNVGLQCHTAPFSWKLVFECDHQLFEVTMSACSPKEELEWRSRLADHSSRQSLDAGEQALYTSLSLAIKSMGTVFGKPGQLLQNLRSAFRIWETQNLDIDN
jgi:hypothetical protein